MVAILEAVALAAFFGTIYAMQKGSPPKQSRVLVINDQPTNFMVRVVSPRTNEFIVSKSGETLVDVPALPHGCSLVCLGITLSDGSPYNRKVIEVLRDGRIVRRLSLRQMERLPTDASGAKGLAL